MIYLISPYSHPDPSIREYRMRQAAQTTYILMSHGEIVFSPIVHGHALVANVSECTETSWGFWGFQCLGMLDKADAVYVLDLDGWEESVGVDAELKYADSLCLPIFLLRWRDILRGRINPIIAQDHPHGSAARLQPVDRLHRLADE